MKKIKVNIQPNEISVKLKGGPSIQTKKEPLFQKLKTLFEETISKLRQSADGLKKETFQSVLTDIESILSTKELREAQTLPHMDIPRSLQNKTADTLQTMIHSFLNTRSSLVSGAAATSLQTKTQNCIRLLKLKSKVEKQNKVIIDFVSEIATDQIKTQFQEKYAEEIQIIQTYLKQETLDLDELLKIALDQQDDEDKVEKHIVEQECMEELFFNEIKHQKILRKIFDLQKERSARVQVGDLDVISDFDDKIKNLKNQSATLSTTKLKLNILKETDSASSSESEENKTKRNVQWDETLHFDDDEEEQSERRRIFSQIRNVGIINKLVLIKLEFDMHIQVLHDFKTNFRHKLHTSMHECWAKALVQIQKQEEAEFRTIKYDLEKKVSEIDTKIHTLNDELLQLDPGAESAISLLHSNYNLTVDLSRDVIFSKYLTALWNLISKLE
jgi:hypothetical protein